MEADKTISFCTITVCFNAVASIEKTLLSIICQNYSNIQIIVIDGGSTDGTLEIINRYRGKIDIFISEKDAGIYDAMNKGIQLVDADYAIFMNAGDSFVNESVVSDVSRCIKKEGIYYGDSIRVQDNKNQYFREAINRFSLTRRNICHQTIFYPQKALKASKYNLKYKVLADWAMNIELYKHVNFHHLDIPICNYYLDGISSTPDPYKDKSFIDDLPKLVKNSLGFFPYLFVLLRRAIKLIYETISCSNTRI